MAEAIYTERARLRPASSADLSAIARVIYDDPEPPVMRLLGGIERASAVGRALVMNELEIAIPNTTVAVVGDRVVGVMECGTVARRATAGRVIRALPGAARALGPGRLLPVLFGLRYRQRVQFAPVAGAFPVGALYVSPTFRNRGIGSLMLAHADHVAREAVVRLMSIETGTTNPARRLYERHGYRLEAEKIDADYERVTGSPGRVLLLKRLG